MITAATDNYPQTQEFLDGHPATRLEDHQNSSEELHRLRRENEKLTEIFQFGVREMKSHQEQAKIYKFFTVPQHPRWREHASPSPKA